MDQTNRHGTGSLSWESYIEVADDVSSHSGSDLGHSLPNEADSDADGSDVDEPVCIVHDEADFEYDNDELQPDEHIIDMSNSIQVYSHSDDSDIDSEADMFVTLEEVQPDDTEEIVDKESDRASQRIQPGQCARDDTVFCPIVPISKFPYKFLASDHAEEVAGCLFNSGKFWMRKLDLYYLWPITDIIPKPIVFTLSTHFDEMIRDINTAFPVLQLDPQNAVYQELGLLIDFPRHPYLTPRYLGTSSSKEEYQRLINFIPPHDYIPSGETSAPNPDKESLQAFGSKIEALRLITTNKPKDRKIKKLQKRLRSNRRGGNQLARAQRYLGLCDANDEDDQASTPINIDEPPHFPFEDDLVLIAIDCEAYEEGSRPVTEVGIVSVDTRDLRGLAPGEKAVNWFDHIHCRHVRIEEYASLKNSRFVPGCPERFDFGTSEFIPQLDAPRLIASLFRPPFARRSAEESGAVSTEAPAGSRDAEEVTDLADVEKRNILLIGHDTMQDVHYLQKLGYDPQNLANLREIADTAYMWRTYRQESQTISLANLLALLGLDGWNLHNAGNDAAFTMQAFLAMCVTAASEGAESRKERHACLEAELEERIESLKPTLEEQQCADGNGSGDAVGVGPASMNKLRIQDQADQISDDNMHRSKSEPKSRSDRAESEEVLIDLDARPDDPQKLAIPIHQQTADDLWSSEDESEMSKQDFVVLHDRLSSIRGASGRTNVEDAE